MSDEENKNELDKLFSEYEERKQKEREKEEIRQSEQQALRDKTIESITKTIIPIMLEFKKKCEEKGYYVAIVQRLKNHSYPNVEFSFKPKQQDPFSGYIASSTITFTHSDEGKIIIKRDIEGKQSANLNYADEIAVETVNKQSIRVTLESFIKNVLKAN